MLLRRVRRAAVLRGALRPGNKAINMMEYALLGLDVLFGVIAAAFAIFARNEFGQVVFSISFFFHWAFSTYLEYLDLKGKLQERNEEWQTVHDYFYGNYNNYLVIVGSCIFCEASASDFTCGGFDPFAGAGAIKLAVNFLFLVVEIHDFLGEASVVQGWQLTLFTMAFPLSFRCDFGQWWVAIFAVFFLLQYLVLVPIWYHDRNEKRSGLRRTDAQIHGCRWLGSSLWYGALVPWKSLFCSLCGTAAKTNAADGDAEATTGCCGRFIKLFVHELAHNRLVDYAKEMEEKGPSPLHFGQTGEGGYWGGCCCQPICAAPLSRYYGLDVLRERAHWQPPADPPVAADSVDVVVDATAPAPAAALTMDDKLPAAAEAASAASASPAAAEAASAASASSMFFCAESTMCAADADDK